MNVLVRLLFTKQISLGRIREGLALFTAINGAEKHEMWPLCRLDEEPGNQYDLDKHNRTKKYRKKLAQHTAQL